VLAYRIGPDGAPLFLLITSRETKRWVVPRGKPILGLAAHQTAAQEAWEEAGITGAIDASALGAYRYSKGLRDGSAVPASVQIFAFRVAEQKPDWPERHQRDTRWFTRDDAVAAVDEQGLKEIIRAFTPG